MRAVYDRRTDVPVLELRSSIAADDRDDLRSEGLETDGAVERRVHRRAVRARDVDAEVEAAVHALRGHPDPRIAEEPRTGCWRSKGFTGQPYAGAVPAPAVAGITSAPSWSRAAAAATAAIARRERARSLGRACEVAMRPRSSGPKRARSRPPHRSPTDAGRPLGGRPWECYKRSMQDFRILGTLEVIGESGPVTLGGPRPRALLAALLLRAGHVVPTEQLVDELYGAEPPKFATASLQNSVAALQEGARRRTSSSPARPDISSPSRRSRSMRAASSSC